MYEQEIRPFTEHTNQRVLFVRATDQKLCEGTWDSEQWRLYEAHDFACTIQEDAFLGWIPKPKLLDPDIYVGKTKLRSPIEATIRPGKAIVVFLDKAHWYIGAQKKLLGAVTFYYDVANVCVSREAAASEVLGWCYIEDLVLQD